MAKAGEWGIAVVSPAWLWDSTSSGARLAEKSYGVGPCSAPPHSVAVLPAAAAAAARPSDATMVHLTAAAGDGSAAAAEAEARGEAARGEVAVLRARVAELEGNLVASGAEAGPHTPSS